MKIKWIVMLLLMFCMLISSIEASAANNDARKIVRDVEKTLKNLETLNCSFEHTRYRKADDKTVIMSGTLYMKKPYMLRVEYPAQTIVVDGETVWSYVPRNRQVQITGFIEDDECFPTPQSIFEKNSKGRESEFAGNEKVDGKECDILRLVSSVPEEKSIMVWIDKKLNFPVKTIEEYTSGDIMQFILKDVVLNGAIEDELFTFVVPEGVETVDMRE